MGIQVTAISGGPARKVGKKLPRAPYKSIDLAEILRQGSVPVHAQALNQTLNKFYTTMVSSTLSSDAKSSPRIISRSLGYDFALLGLSARESRVEVIRQAAEKTAAKIHDAATDEAETDSMLTDLAASTYRLLDPRKRQKMIERVQLCIHSEQDLDLQKASRSRLLTPSGGLPGRQSRNAGSGTRPPSAESASVLDCQEVRAKTPDPKCIVSELVNTPQTCHRTGTTTVSLIAALGMLISALVLAVI